MTSILALARPDIVALKAYSHASWDPAFERLHANELPWRAETDRSLAGLNRYPEPHPHVLAQRLATLYGVADAQLLPGRGSDESIDLLVRGFCRAGVDNVVICPPTFGMYAVAARIQGAEVREVPLAARARFRARYRRRARRPATRNTKIVFLCSPNNPTGNAMAPAAIEQLLARLRTARWWWSTRPTSSSPATASLTTRARALSEPRGAAHLVEGLWPGRRARGLADRRARNRGAARPR